MSVKEKYKREFAAATADAFRRTYRDIGVQFGNTGPFNEAEILAAIEHPKDPQMGWLAVPVHRFSGLLGQSPVKIAASVQSNYQFSKGTAFATLAVNAFVNARVPVNELATRVLSEALSQGQSYGSLDIGAGKRCLVEYSSPNIAKPFGVGHLRSTVIGNSLRRIFKKLGYNVTGINYPGDWGTQFGKMIVAYRRWGKPGMLEGEKAIANLLDLYVRFHAEVETDRSLDEEARTEFKRLEEGVPEAVRLWEQFKTISNAEFDRIYGRLGVEFDLVYGESFLNDKMETVIDRLSKAGLTKMSDGALIVDLHEPNLPPALLRKADGATLYLTRDLAGAYYRWDRFRFDESLYVVGSSQADHFKQMIAVISRLEEAEKTLPAERISARIRHVDFGWVKFGDKTMSTRRGNIIFLEDVLDQAVTLARSKIREKNPSLAHFEETAQMIGVGAVIFSQLSVRRHKDVNFVWEEVLNFEGETGPYLQYTHARLCSLARLYGKPIAADVDCRLLDKFEEQRILELLADFPETVELAAKNYDPHHVSVYLLRLAGAFNKFYQRKDSQGRIDKIISENVKLTAARMALVKAVQTVLHEGLYLLGLKAPEEM
ncbi:MAG: arginine--tRNA ligase [Candidatus Zixiibacteriota bacterium]